MVDLSKAKVGDIAVFRCGGEAVIESIEKDEFNQKVYLLEYSNGNGTRFSYNRDGNTAWGKTPYLMDIVSIKPAPEPLPDAVGYVWVFEEDGDMEVCEKNSEYDEFERGLYCKLKITFNPNTLEAKAEVVK